MNEELKDLLRSVIREELTPINERLDRIEAEQQNMRTDIQRMKDDIQSLKEDMLGVKSNMSTKDDLTRLATKEDVALLPSIQQAVSEAGKSLERLEDAQARMEGTLKGHEITLDLLSRRSIDQEAAIKRIK